MKVQKQKNRIPAFILKDSFRTTFYFPVRAEKTILSCAISDKLKEQLKKVKTIEKSGDYIIHYKKKDVEDAKELIALKLKILS